MHSIHPNIHNYCIFSSKSVGSAAPLLKTIASCSLIYPVALGAYHTFVATEESNTGNRALVTNLFWTVITAGTNLLYKGLCTLWRPEAHPLNGMNEEELKAFFSQRGSTKGLTPEDIDYLSSFGNKLPGILNTPVVVEELRTFLRETCRLRTGLDSISEISLVAGEPQDSGATRYIGSDPIELPLGLFLLENLRELKIHCPIKGNFPPGIANLTQLSELMLTHTGLKELPEEISCIPELVHLNLSFNPGMKLPESLGNLSKLTWIGLGSSELEEVPSFVGRLTELEEICLSGNKLREVPQFLCEMPSLTTEVVLCDNHLLTELPEAIFQLPKSCDILVCGCPLTNENVQFLHENAVVDSPTITFTTTCTTVDSCMDPLKKTLKTIYEKLGKSSPDISTFPRPGTQFPLLHLLEKVAYFCRNERSPHFRWLANSAVEVLDKSATGSPLFQEFFFTGTPIKDDIIPRLLELQIAIHYSGEEARAQLAFLHKCEQLMKEKIKGLHVVDERELLLQIVVLLAKRDDFLKKIDLPKDLTTPCGFSRDQILAF